MTAPVAQQVGTTRGEKIAMTAPVSDRRQRRQMVMRFFMPADKTMESLPQPKEPAVAARERHPRDRRSTSLSPAASAPVRSHPRLNS